MNVAGGLFHTRTQNANGVPDMCWSTDTATPTSGSTLVLTACREGAPAQMFSYRADHSIYSTSGNLCLQSTGVAGSRPAFRPCTGAAPQVWMYTSADQFSAVDSTGTNVIWSCITITDPYQDGSPLALATTCPTQQYNIWSPDPRTGPGGAGASTYQLVNFDQFARCFDVVNLKWDNYFMQLHPCHQSPGALDWPWQQLMYEPATRRFRFGNPGNLTSYCLTSPGSSSSEYVTTSTCTNSRAQQWTNTGDSGVWAASYTIVDADGRCLSKGPVPPDPQRTFSSIIVAPCDGSAAQKWNAPGDLVNAGIQGFRETTGAP
jgi:hypothetical protein